MYSYTNFGMPLRCAFSSTIPKSCNSNSTSYLIPNVVGSSTFPLISISTQIVSSTSFLRWNTIRTIPSTSYLTSIATKYKSIFLLIPPCSLSKNDWNFCNELVARFNTFRIRSSYYRNSKLRISFVLTKWFFNGKNGFIWNMVGKSCIHFLGSCSLVSKVTSYWVDWTVCSFGV